MLATLDYGDDPSEPLICKFPSSERPRPRWVSPEAWINEIIEMNLGLEEQFAEDEAVATFVDDGPFIGEGVVSWVADVNTRVGVGIVGLSPAGNSLGNTSVSVDIVDENNLIISFEGFNSLVYTRN